MILTPAISTLIIFIVKSLIAVVTLKNTFLEIDWFADYSSWMHLLCLSLNNSISIKLGELLIELVGSILILSLIIWFKIRSESSLKSSKTFETVLFLSKYKLSIVNNSYFL